MKIGRYSDKVQAMRKAMQQLLDNNTDFKNQSAINGMVEEFKKANLVSSAMFLGRMSSAPYLRDDFSAFLDQIKVVMIEAGVTYKDVIKTHRERFDALKNTDMNNGELVNEIVSKADEKLAKIAQNYLSKRKEDAIDKEYKEILTQSNLGSTKNAAICLGCSDVNLYGILVDPGMEHFDNIGPTEGPNRDKKLSYNYGRGPIIIRTVRLEEGKERQNFAELSKCDYKSIVQSFVDKASSIQKAIDKASGIFKVVDNLQNTLDKEVSILEKSKFIDDSDSPALVGMTNHYIKCCKEIAISVPGVITKVYFSTIRDYLVIGNIILKNLNSK